MHARLFAVIAVFVACAVATPAMGQAPDIEKPLHRVSEDMNIIRGQVELALRYQRKALLMLQTDGRTPASVDAARDTAKEGYVLVRYSLAGLELKAERSDRFKRFRDPLIDMTRTKLHTAWDMMRVVVQHGQLEVQVQNAQQAIGLLEEALLLI